MYPTDLTQTQWQFIKKALDFDDRKRKYDLIVIWNAISFGENGLSMAVFTL